MSFARNLSEKYRKKLLDPTTKAGSDTSKTDSKKVNHKTAEATDELIGNKIADKTVKPLPVPDANWRDVEKIVIPPQRRKEVLNELTQVLSNGKL